MEIKMALTSPRSGLWSKSTLKKLYPDMKDEVNKLYDEEDMQLYQPVRKVPVRRQTLASKIDLNWQMDLMEIGIFKDSNNSYRYLLTAIDVLSRYAFVVPLKDKSAESILNGVYVRDVYRFRTKAISHIFRQRK